MYREDLVYWNDDALFDLVLDIEHILNGRVEERKKVELDQLMSELSNAKSELLEIQQKYDSAVHPSKKRFLLPTLEKKIESYDSISSKLDSLKYKYQHVSFLNCGMPVGS